VPLHNEQAEPELRSVMFLRKNIGCHMNWTEKMWVNGVKVRPLSEVTGLIFNIILITQAFSD
jgi:hypothetical protein